MTFSGSSEHTIDDKNRLSIASKFRAELPPSVRAWYCVPWPTGELRLYPESTFLELSSQWEQSLAPTDEEAEMVSTLFEFAEKLEMDSGGRIRLPKKHIRLVGIGSAVAVTGANNRLVIRDLESWQAEEQNRFEKLRNLVARTTRSSE